MKFRALELCGYLSVQEKSERKFRLPVCASAKTISPSGVKYLRE